MRPRAPGGRRTEPVCAASAAVFCRMAVGGDGRALAAVAELACRVEYDRCLSVRLSYVLLRVVAETVRVIKFLLSTSESPIVPELPAPDNKAT
eukprot:746140-Hanusia_phi.AAC.2